MNHFDSVVCSFMENPIDCKRVFSILQEVEMLTEEMFMKQIHKGYHFVQFTIPSNKVCKLMAPDWEKLTETYKNKDKVTVSQVSIV